MEVGSPEWIEASLARLDELERQRGEHEAALESAHDPLTLKQHNDALERLDAEIKSLYAQLESVAGDEEDEEDESEADEVEPRATQGDDELSSPHVMAGAGASAFAAAAASSISAEPSRPAPEPASDNPFGSSPSPAFDSTVITDEDLKVKGGGGKWVFIGLVVVAGLGVGGFFAWQNMQAQKAKEQTKTAPAEEIKIEAAAIPEDTEAPNAAKGGDATISPTANPDSGSTKTTKKPAEEKKKKPIKLKTGDDPLG